MAPSIRTISILMLLAGVSLGVFAGTLVADDPGTTLGTSRVSDAVNQRAAYYQRIYGLDDVQTDEIRQVLESHQRSLRDEMRALWRANQDAFDVISMETDDKIESVLLDAGVAPERLRSADAGKGPEAVEDR